MAAHRKLVAVIAAATAVAVAAPAFASDTLVPVTVLGLGGSRLFAVEDLTGASLSSIDLGTGGAQPFRTHVTDSAFLPTAASGSYDVSATLSNLYLKSGPGSTAADYNYNVKVPSSAVSVGFGSNPLAVSGLSLVDLPKLSLTGAINSCAGMGPTLQGILGLSSLGVVLGSNSALSNLCSTLPLSGSTAVTTTVDGALQTVTSTLTDLTKLPTALSGATGGTFTKPSFVNGMGANDTAGAAAATAAAAPAIYQPDSVPLMSGTTASALTSTFATDLQSKLTALLTGPLTSATGVGTQTQLASVVSQLQASSTPVLSQLGAVLNTLSAANQASVINSIFTSAVPTLPVIGDVQGITGSSYSFPVLRATPTTPVAGTYGGTMTVTFFQH